MIEKILSRKWLYVLMIPLLVIYLKKERLILNESIILNILLVLIPFITILYFSYNYSPKKMKFHVMNNILGAIILTIFTFVVFKIAINYFIYKSSENNEVIELNVPIDNFISGRSGMVYFYFKGERYGLRYDNENNLSRNEIISDFKLQIDYVSSICDMYVIQNYEITKK